jgi:hypothetical protein
MKPNGLPIDNKCSLINNKVRFTVSQAMSSCHGRSPCKIRFINPTTGGVTETVRFHLIIDEDVYNDAQITESAEYTLLADALIRVGDIDGNFITVNSKIALMNDIQGTTQITSLDSNNDITKIQHVDSLGEVIREDIFVYDTDTVTETRTLYTGEHMTYIYHLDTYVTEVK